MAEVPQARWRAPRPTLPIQHVDRYYIAGLVEGEGSFYLRNDNKYPQVVFQLNMADEDVVRYAWKRAGCFGTVSLHDGGPSAIKQQWRWRMGAAAEVSWFMDQMFPLMGSRRQAKITELRAYLPEWAKEQAA